MKPKFGTIEEIECYGGTTEERYHFSPWDYEQEMRRGWDASAARFDELVTADTLLGDERWDSLSREQRQAEIERLAQEDFDAWFRSEEPAKPS